MKMICAISLLILKIFPLRQYMQKWFCKQFTHMQQFVQDLQATYQTVASMIDRFSI